MRRLLWLSFIPFFLWSCEDKMDEHYEVPGWVKGSAWELLSDESMDGNFPYYLYYKSNKVGGIRLVLSVPWQEHLVLSNNYVLTDKQ